MTKMRVLVVILFLTANMVEVKSHHISGGEMSYECLEFDPILNTYRLEFKYKLYQDCASDLISDPITVKFWQYGLDTFYIFQLDSIFATEDSLYSCLELDAEFCNKELLYRSTIEVDLTNSDTYLYAYNCCRTNNLVNVVDNSMFGDVASVHSICIGASGVQVCNNSAKFEYSVPSYLCNEEFFELPQLATDIDNDQLVYEFCTPYESFDTFSPFQMIDFEPISYNLPNYSIQDPLGQNVLNLDSNTGVLSGIPTQSGSYVVGICVNEYRNGQYLSTTRRDIQVNVVQCEPFVSAHMEADEISVNGTYIINSCNNQSPTFINLSTQEDNISNLIWSFDIGDEIETSTEWSPTIYFENPGSYNGNLILNPDEECSDTLNFIVNIVADVVPDFVADYDTCISGPVEFYNNSYAEGSALSTFEWSFGDDTFSNEFAPLKTYEIPGEFQIDLKVTDEFGCKDSISGIIDWRPAPAIIIISPETAASCAPLRTTFKNLSWPIDSTYSFTWDFGDGSTLSNNMSPNHEYLAVGVYDVTISVESPIGCYVDSVFQELIIVEPRPVANFDYSPQAITQFNSTIDLIDISERAINWRWFFDQADSTWLQEPAYTFADTGLHTIKLIVQDFYGCADTLTKILDVIPKVTYFLPNAFSPNGDGINDLFHAKGLVNEMLEFELNILDRWGGLLYRTTNPLFEWNGLHQSNGQIVSKGVYVYQLSYTTRRGKVFQDQGYVNLVK